MAEVKKLNGAQLLSVSQEQKRIVLKFRTPDNREHKISDFKDTGLSTEAEIDSIYEVDYVENLKEGMQFPFKNLRKMTRIEDVPVETEAGENIKDEPIGNANRIKQPMQAPENMNEVFKKKDIANAKLGCLRDALQFFEVQAALKNIKEVNKEQVYIVANDFLKNIYPEAEGFK
jgi:hypothetical protein